MKREKIHRVAVLSDTHDLVRPQVEDILSSVELILHAGDITRQEILEQLGRFAPVVAVRGNCDGAWADTLPEERMFELHGRKVSMVHNRSRISPQAREADLIICGHTHRYEARAEFGTLWLNPGSCGPRRFGQPVTMSLLEFRGDSGAFQARKIDLTGQSTPQPSGGASPSGAPGPRPADLDRIVTQVVKGLKKGRSVELIARTGGYPLELVKEISQIYYTHPGVDLEGILNRLEIAGK